MLEISEACLLGQVLHPSNRSHIEDGRPAGTDEIHTCGSMFFIAGDDMSFCFGGFSMSAGVLNVAALLNYSDSMLVCWDTTYAHRLAMRDMSETAVMGSSTACPEC